MLCNEFDLSILVDESRFQGRAHLGRSFASRLQELGIPIDEFLSAISIHLTDIGAEEQAIVHLERASEVLRTQRCLYNK
jgi:hypothetical protein